MSTSQWHAGIKIGSAGLFFEILLWNLVFCVLYIDMYNGTYIVYVENCLPRIDRTSSCAYILSGA